MFVGFNATSLVGELVKSDGGSIGVEGVFVKEGVECARGRVIIV